MQFEELKKFLITELEDMKAENIEVFDVRQITSITDMMIVCTGNSSRHVKSIASKVGDKARATGIRPLGMEGEADAEWVLLDLGDAIIHVMQAKTRDIYQLENLWNRTN